MVRRKSAASRLGIKRYAIIGSKSYKLKQKASSYKKASRISRRKASTRLSRKRFIRRMGAVDG